MRAKLHEAWDGQPGWLNTASYGLPPRPGFEALQQALSEWRRGLTSWESWDESTNRSREAWARLVNVDATSVTVNSTVSGLLAPLAAALPSGSTVIVPAREFTSNVYPWLVHADRGVGVRAVPQERLAESINSSTTVVAFSLVQSADGYVTPYHDVISAARRHGALTVIDATQACGWFPIEGSAADVIVAAGYKWLMAPRGTAFGYFAPHVADKMRPIGAGWYAGESIFDSFYGTDMKLATTARRFDVSPAWFSYVGAAPALELIMQIGVEAVREHNVSLANRFLSGLGLPPTNSAIVAVETRPDAAERLEAAGVKAAVRAGRMRASFHIYTTEEDVDQALTALR